MRSLLAAGVLAVGLFLTGCPSVSTLGLARTIDKGQFQVALAPGGIGATVNGVPGGFGQMEVAGRYGVTERFEFGAKLWFPGAAVDGKFSLIRSDGQNGFDLAIDPSISYAGFAVAGAGGSGGVGTTNLTLPVLLGFNFSGHQLVLGPRVVDLIVSAGASGSGTSGSATSNSLMLGTSIGFALKLGDNFRLMPELTVLYPTFTSASANGGGGSVSTSGIGGGAVFQASLALIFGGYSAPAPIASESPGNL